MAVTKPTALSQKGWDYVKKFTTDHEYPVFHFYNNKQTENAKQDITFGIGVFVPSPEASLQYKANFHHKTTNLPATDEQMKADWEIAGKILRKGNNLAEYGEKCQLRVKKDYVYELMAKKLKDAFERNLNRSAELSTFLSYPEQAQVACASYFYGRALSASPLMALALDRWDFREAGVQSNLRGMSQRKFKAHSILFENAAQIVGQGLDYSLLPTKTEPPEALPKTVDDAEAATQGLVISTSLKVARMINPFSLLGFGRNLY